MRKDYLKIPLLAVGLSVAYPLMGGVNLLLLA